MPGLHWRTRRGHYSPTYGTLCSKGASSSLSPTTIPLVPGIISNSGSIGSPRLSELGQRPAVTRDTARRRVCDPAPEVQIRSPCPNARGFRGGLPTPAPVRVALFMRGRRPRVFTFQDTWRKAETGPDAHFHPYDPDRSRSCHAPGKCVSRASRRPSWNPQPMPSVDSTTSTKRGKSLPAISAHRKTRFPRCCKRARRYRRIQG